MQSISPPPKFPVPFASGAAPENIRQVPAASQIQVTPGAASLTDGFPPLNFQAVAAGGVPPFGQDMNGILNQATKWNQWQSAGGPIRFDAAFAASIGGYPFGAFVQSNTGHLVYQSVAEDNTSDPNSGGSQWRVASCTWSSLAIQATGSSNAQLISLSPTPTSLSQLIGIPLKVISQGANTGATTLNPNNLGNIPVQFPGGISLRANSLLGGAVFEVVYNGSVFILLSATSVFTDPGITGLTIDGTQNPTSGANLLLKGNGATTPNKFIRVASGILGFINSAYTAVITSIDDIGNFHTIGTIAADGAISSSGNMTSNGLLVSNTAITANAGNITANVGRLRAGLGATGSGDPSAASILSDFGLFYGADGIGGLFGSQKLPTGFIIQVGHTASVTGADLHTFATPFPTACIACLACEGDPTGWGVTGQAPTVFGVGVATATNAKIYVTRWNGSAWVLTGGISTRYIALGY